MDDKIFVNAVESSDKTYNIINNEHEDAHILMKKSYIENLWKEYKPYADPNFIDGIRQDFDSRFWEMYLTCTLLDKKYPVKKKNKSEGPDILIKNKSHRIWMEAIAPTRGAENSPDTVPEMKPNIANRVPDEEIALRYCSAIIDKFIKHSNYLKNGTIMPEDLYVIAINSCKIPEHSDSKFPPRIVRAVFPIGNRQFTIDEQSNTLHDNGFQSRPNINKASGFPVSTSIFLDQKFGGISGVLYSRISIRSFNIEKMDTNFIFVHNPLATNKIPEGYFPFGREFILKDVGDKYKIVSREY
jgi:hypothetical protein